MTTKGKLIIFSAPSGSGKSTIIDFLMTQSLQLAFSISATSREPRGKEKNGNEYLFLSTEEFKQKIEEDAFLEWEEVYKDTFYGTLKSVPLQMINEGKNVVFDVDVIGGCNLKEYYGEKALSVFIMPPSIEVLQERLLSRGTDTLEVIKKRIDKAEKELTYASKFDVIIKNDNLEIAQEEALDTIRNFIRR